MDFATTLAGIASLSAVIALAYNIHQHRDNIRKEFLLWALQQMQSPDQRKNRTLFWMLNRPENERKKKRFIDGIVNGSDKVLGGEDYSQLRGMFALFSEIGYFWLKLGYGNVNDLEALFPQLLVMWEPAQPYLKAIRGRPYQGTSFQHYDLLVNKLLKSRKHKSHNKLFSLDKKISSRL